MEVVIEGLEVDILEKIKITKGKNKEVVRVVNWNRDRGETWQNSGRGY